MTSVVESTYRKWEGRIQIAALFLIPLSIFIVGYFASTSNEQLKVKQEYVRIAVGVLSQKVKEQSDVDEIRVWATDVLALYSPLPLSAEQREALISGKARLSGETTAYYNYTYGTYDYDVPYQAPAGSPTINIPTKEPSSEKNK